jgi:hypothetical protein
MDPLTTATGLATIVGLIHNFRQERKGHKDATHREFIEWLEYHRHEQIKKWIENSHNLTMEVDALLKEDTEQILMRLDGIDGVLAQILSRVEGFSGIARIVHPEIEISDQAVHVLRSLANSQSDKFSIIRQMGGPAFLSMNRGGNIDILDHRFMEADLDTLVRLGLLRIDYGSKGTPWYGITREAVRFIGLVDSKDQNR